MQKLFVAFLIVFVKIVDVFPSNQECTSVHFRSFMGIFEQCHHNDYCLTLDSERSHMKFFSTKTAYQTEKSHDETSDFYIEGCTPSKIWLLIRHGTRFPTANGIKRFGEMEKFRDKIVENAIKLPKMPLCLEDLNMLKNWKWNYSITRDQENFLVTQGYNELSAIARNYKRYFPSLLGKSYDADHFNFRHTNTERTRSSFRAFVTELFGELAHKKINAETPTDRPDVLLKGYANCPLWRDQKKKLKRSDSEARKFEHSKAFQKLIADVDSRFGFNGTLQVKDIKNIYDMCRYEQAWQIDRVSVWCSLLTPSQVHVIEYLEDLNYFYKSSHGSKLNKHIKCFAMKDMLNRLSTDDGQKASVYFSHSAAVQLFLTSLEALKDEMDLTAENFEQIGSNRKWRTSKISPFAANIAVVRYKCPTNDKAKFFLNENILHFDWCTPNTGVCDWHDVEQKYAFYAHEDCNKVFCRHPK